MKRYFALFEIIGFESFVNNNAVEEVDRLYKRLCNDIKDNIIDWEKSLYEKHGYFVIEISFSGKHILITAENNSSASLFYICTASQIVLALSLADGFPLLGCLHCGYIQDNSGLAKTNDIPRYETMRRPGYWEALTALEIGPVSGCLLTGAALENFEDIKTRNTYTLGDMYKLNLLVPVPVSGIEHEAIAVNWMANQHINFSHGFISSIFTKHNKEIDDRINTLIDNTVAFITIVQAERLN